ncbi:MAG: hypothetical protein K2W33_10835, partial [Burkholderiales bacterium]|nr:hypothetical protein [Burkholderiales bacterium]
YPNRSGPDILPVTAAFAAMQDWDGLYFFDYVDGQAERSLPNNFNLQGDWPKTAMIGLAARVFRTPTVTASTSVVHAVSADSDWFVATALDRRPDAWERFLGKYKRLTGSDALAARIVNTTAAGQTDVRASATPAFQYRQGDRQVLISAPTVIGVLGELGASQPLRVDTLSVVPPAGSLPTDTVSLVLHSLDGLPLPDARHMLLSVPTRVMGSQVGRQTPQVQQVVPYKGDRSWWTLEPAAQPAGQPSSPRRATAPLWLERKALTVTLKSKAPSLTVYPLGPTGTRGEALAPQAVIRTPDGYELKLNALPGQAALWFEITSP